MSVVKDVINSIDPKEENAAKTKECLQLLYELSEENANAYIESD